MMYGVEDATQKMNKLTHYSTHALSLDTSYKHVYVYMYMYRHIYTYVLLPRSRTARAF